MTRTQSTENNCTRLYVTLNGILVGLAGMIHGGAEALQGNRATKGWMLNSIGAFTLIPNYLVTGLVAILVGLCLTIWTIRFIHTEHGMTIFLILSITLFLVGGGVMQVLFFLVAWGVGIQIRQPLTWWRKTMSQPIRKQLAQWWWLSFAAGYLFLFVGIVIWLVFTPPGAAYKNPGMQYILWANLFIGIVFQLLTIISGFAKDIQKRTVDTE